VQQAVVVGVVVVPVHVEAGARVVRRTGDHAVSHARERVENAVACAHVVRYQPTNLCIYIQGGNEDLFSGVLGDDTCMAAEARRAEEGGVLGEDAVSLLPTS